MRREFSRWFSPPNFVEVLETRMSRNELSDLVSNAYPAYAISNIFETDNPRVPVRVYLTRNTRQIERRFNPYTGEDLGDPFPPTLRVLEWLVDLHDNLLSGQAGRKVNGIGGAVLLVIVLTGAVLWWPGRHRWRDSLYVTSKARGQQFLFRLHSAIGFWSFLLLLIWSATAIYFAFPAPFESMIDRFDADPTDFERPGERFLTTLIAGHFGRFGSLGVRFVWITLGTVPIVLLVSGFLLWWRRRRGSGRRQVSR